MADVAPGGENQGSGGNLIWHRTPSRKSGCTPCPPEPRTRPMTPEDREDQALMASVKRGDRQAFESLYSRHGPPILRFLYRLCADRALAEDLTQDVFLKVWHAAAGWRPIGRVSTWLFQIANPRTGATP